MTLLGVDEVPQAMLLRALEEKRFVPVGADRETSSDFQLIAGTNRDLRDAVVQGRFRHDLLSRIDVWTFELPGLVERREDLEPSSTSDSHQLRTYLARFNLSFGDVTRHGEERDV